MTRPIAIFDNTVFNISARIRSYDLIGLSSNLFGSILVPEEVRKEMEAFPNENEDDISVTKRMELYSRKIEPRKVGLQLCTTLDPVVCALLQGVKNIDKGESEMVAQAEKRMVNYIFTDDLRCVNVLRPLYPHLRFRTTIDLVSLLDVAGFVPDYQILMLELLEYVKLPKSKKKRILRLSYQEALRHFSLSLDKKILAKKFNTLFNHL